MENSSVRTIDRLVEILNCFTQDRTTWSLSELSVRLGLPKSTLHRFLVGLERHGIMRRDENGKWLLGHQLFIWGSLAVESTGLRQLAAPIMRELAERTGETVILTECRNGEVICIEKIETSHSVRLAMNVGAVRAPHAGASSKVLLAFLPEVEVDRVINLRGLPRLCSRTITEPTALHTELAQIRQFDYAKSYEETDFGAWGIATPIRNWRAEVVAALGIAGPTVRYSEQQMQDHVQFCRDASERISRLWGYKPTPTIKNPNEVQNSPPSQATPGPTDQSFPKKLVDTPVKSHH